LTAGVFSFARVISVEMRRYSFVLSVNSLAIISNNSVTSKGFSKYPSALSLTAFIALSIEGCPVIDNPDHFWLQLFQSVEQFSAFHVRQLYGNKGDVKNDSSQALMASLPFSTPSIRYPPSYRTEESIFLTPMSSSTMSMLFTKIVTPSFLRSLRCNLTFWFKRDMSLVK